MQSDNQTHSFSSHKETNKSHSFQVQVQDKALYWHLAKWAFLCWFFFHDNNNKRLYMARDCSSPAAGRELTSWVRFQRPQERSIHPVSTRAMLRMAVNELKRYLRRLRLSSQSSISICETTNLFWPKPFLCGPALYKHVLTHTCTYTGWKFCLGVF